ncbi:MAG: hypothetical protein K2Y27_22410 [Xanthobacteraceae bacterium]|nr:hypothetical protein [Xanthobacteraceae bacterium]
MTIISVNSGTASGRFDAIFAAAIASCADFCAGARPGRDIEGRYHELAAARPPTSTGLASPIPTSRRLP